LILTVQGEFNEVLLLPSLTSDKEFVAGLEGYTMLIHHLLANLACSSFGKKETANMLLMFLLSYLHFNLGFIDNVETLMGPLDNEGHIKMLGENLKEEMRGRSLHARQWASAANLSRVCCTKSCSGGLWSSWKWSCSVHTRGSSPRIYARN
jgi:hypothetical protein